MEREYPETESHLPESQRSGHVPAALWEVLSSYHARDVAVAPQDAKDTESASQRVTSPHTSVLEEKNATPGVSSRMAEACLDNVEPLSCGLDRSVRAVGDPGTQRKEAYASYSEGDLHVQARFGNACSLLF